MFIKLWLYLKHSTINHYFTLSVTLFDNWFGKKVIIKKKKPKQMNNYSIAAQVIVALSIAYVWIFRFDNIVREFKHYNLSNLTRSIVGFAKIALSTLLVAGIWYADLVLVPALLIALLMLSAQFFHFKVSNPWQKHIPSLLLLILCLFIAAVSLKFVE